MTLLTGRSGAPALHDDGLVPLHEQITEYIRSQIDAGLLPPGQKLPAEADVAADLGVARGTVRRAVHTLREEGVLAQVHGRGTFVASRTTPDTGFIGDLVSNGQRLERRGLYFIDEILEREHDNVCPPQGPFQGGDVLRLTRLRTLLDGPESLIITELRSEFAVGIHNYTDDELTAKSFHRTLQDDFGIQIQSTEDSYYATTASQSLAKRLSICYQSPVLVHDQFIWDAEQSCLEHSRTWTRSDRRVQSMRFTANLI